MDHREDATVPLLGANDQGDSPPEPLGPIWDEIKRILTIAVPICVTEVLSFSSYIFTTAQVGHLGALELSSLGLGQVLFNTTGLSLVIGITTAVETFAGQAFGARQYALAGVTLQRAVILCSIAALPPMVYWIWAKNILDLLGQNKEIIPMAVRFVHVATPVLLVAGAAEACRKYLASQAVVQPLAVISAITLGLTPLINWTFLYVLRWGITGAALAYTTIDTLALLLLVGFIAWHNTQQPQAMRTWQGWSSKALEGWGSYLHIAIPSAAMMMLDWWMFEALVLVAGLLPDAKVQLGAQSACFLLHASVFMSISGLAQAASTRVSNELGAGRARFAQRAMWLSVVMGLGLAAVAAAILTAARGVWGPIFSSDRAVADTMAAAMPWLALSLIGDASNAVLAGVLRGCGRPAIGATINLVSFWILGLPAAFYVALHLGKGVVGIWMVMAAAQTLQGLVFAILVFQFDWNLEARRAQERVHSKDGAPFVPHLPNTLMDI